VGNGVCSIICVGFSVPVRVFWVLLVEYNGVAALALAFPCFLFALCSLLLLWMEYLR